MKCRQHLVAEFEHWVLAVLTYQPVPIGVACSCRHTLLLREYSGAAIQEVCGGATTCSRNSTTYSIIRETSDIQSLGDAGCFTIVVVSNGVGGWF